MFCVCFVYKYYKWVIYADINRFYWIKSVEKRIKCMPTTSTTHMEYNMCTVTIAATIVIAILQALRKKRPTTFFFCFVLFGGHIQVFIGNLLISILPFNYWFSIILLRCHFCFFYLVFGCECDILFDDFNLDCVNIEQFLIFVFA